METQANGKVRRSRAEWESVVEAFGASGLSQSEFCRREGVALSSFQKWQQRFSREGGLKFIELSGGGSKGLEAELEFPGGVVLRLRG